MSRLGTDRVERMIAIGRVDARSARIWCRTDEIGDHSLVIKGGGATAAVALRVAGGNGRDNTASVLFPDDFAGAGDLAPDTRYRVRVNSPSGTIVGTGGFETAPASADDTPKDFSVGVMSCHQPFNNDGVISKRRMRLLSRLPAALAKENLKFVMAVGDQMYSDEPGSHSLFNVRYAERLGFPGADGILDGADDDVRAAFHDRYRTFWHPVPWRKLLSSYPIYPIADDHEVVDDWGSLPEHSTSAKWKRVIRSARRAYMDYQGSFVRSWTADAALPRSFHYGFNYGHTAGFALDLRSERIRGATKAESRVMSDAQRAAFKRFLAANRDARVLFIMTSVPLIHLPEWLTKAGHRVAGASPDFLDHWNTSHCERDRNRILRDIETQLELTGGKQKIICVGGDVHLGVGFVLTWRDPTRFQFYQFTSSPISTSLEGLARLSTLGPDAFDLTPLVFGRRFEARLLRPRSQRGGCNPLLDPNFGLIDIRTRNGGTHVRFRHLGYDPESDSATEKFATGWL